MSTKSTVQSEALQNATELGLGAQEFLSKLIQAQEGQSVEVTYDAKAKSVKMHGSDASPTVNKGVINFSDIKYNIGLNEDENGAVSLVYDSWVGGGKLTRRIEGKSQKKEPANMKTCQNFWRSKSYAKKTGKKLKVEVVEGRAIGFVG